MNCSRVGRPASLNSRIPSERAEPISLLVIGCCLGAAGFAFWAFALGRAAARTLRVFLFAMFSPPVAQVVNNSANHSSERPKGKQQFLVSVNERSDRVPHPPAG